MYLTIQQTHNLHALQRANLEFLFFDIYLSQHTRVVRFISLAYKYLILNLQVCKETVSMLKAYEESEKKEKISKENVP